MGITIFSMNSKLINLKHTNPTIVKLKPTILIDHGKITPKAPISIENKESVNIRVDQIED